MIKILHVDDDSSDLELLYLNLCRISSDLEISGTISASEALEDKNIQDYHCIVSDYQMPGINGLEFLRTLREQNIETPFILLTGQGNEQVAVEAMRLDAAEYFQKSTGVLYYQKLVHSIKNSIHNHKIRCQKARFKSQLQESRELVEKFFNSTEELIFLLDKSLRVIQCNSKALEIFNFSRKEMVGIEFKSLFPDIFISQGETQFSKVIETGKGCQLEVELKLKNKISRYFNIKGFQMENGMGIIASDISVRRLAQKKIFESEKKYRAIFELSGDALFLMDGAGLTEVNKSTLSMFCCSSEQMVSKTPFDFSPPFQPDGQESAKKGALLINKCLQGEVQRFIWQHQKCDGSKFMAEITLKSLEIEGSHRLLAQLRVKENPSEEGFS